MSDKQGPTENIIEPEDEDASGSTTPTAETNPIGLTGEAADVYESMRDQTRKVLDAGADLLDAHKGDPDYVPTEDDLRAAFEARSTPESYPPDPNHGHAVPPVVGNVTYSPDYEAERDPDVTYLEPPKGTPPPYDAEWRERADRARQNGGPVPIPVHASGFSWGDDEPGEGEGEESRAEDDPESNPIGSYAVLTPENARKRKQQEEQGYWFLLRGTRHPDTGEPQRIYVRRVSLLDRATIGNLPRQIQARVMAITTAVDRAGGGKDQQAKVQKLLRTLGRSEEIADAYMIAAAQEPRVYSSLAEADTHGGVYVKDIDVNDRFSFVAACDGTSKGAMALLTPFRGGPLVELDPRADVEDVASATT